VQIAGVDGNGAGAVPADAASVSARRGAGANEEGSCGVGRHELKASSSAGARLAVALCVSPAEGLCRWRRAEGEDALAFERVSD
jgi:hypothetical protein